MKISIVTALAVLMAGCATEGKFRSKMETYLGQPISDVVAKWGAPARAIPVGDGKAYLWDNRGPVVYAYGMSSQYFCEITLITDSSDTVLKWQARGNDCKSR